MGKTGYGQGGDWKQQNKLFQITHVVSYRVRASSAVEAGKIASGFGYWYEPGQGIVAGCETEIDEVPEV